MEKNAQELKLLALEAENKKLKERIEFLSYLERKLNLAKEELSDKQRQFELAMENSRIVENDLLKMNEEYASLNEEYLNSIEELQQQNEEYAALNEEYLTANENLRESQEKLQENESFIRAVLDNLPVGIAVNSVDPTVRFNYMNENFAKIYRTTPEALSNPDSFWESVYEDEKFREAIRKRVVEDCLSGKPEKMVWEDVPITRKNQETTYVNARNIPIADNRLMISMVTDITERKKQEESARLSHRIFRYSLDMVCIAGFDGYFKTLNPAWERTLGWSAEELLSKPWLNFVHPDDVQATENIKSVIVDGREVYQFENRYICKDGSIKWLSWNSYPYPEEKIMFSIARDITEQKKFLAAIIQSEEKYKQLIDTMNDGLMQVDNNDTILFANKRVCEIFGYEENELIGKRGLDIIIHPADKQLVIEKNQIRTENISDKYEVRGVKRSGETIWLDISGSPLIESGDIIGSVGIIRDITEQKRAEEALNASLRTSADIVQSIPSGLFIYKYEAPDKLILLEANPEAERLTGISTEEWAGREFNEIWPTAKESGITDKFLSPTRTGQVFETEDIYYADDRISGAYRVRTFLMPNDRLGVAFEDITKRKQAEDEIRREKDLLKALFDNIPLGISIWDKNGNLLHMNKGAVELAGYNPEDIGTVNSWFEKAYPDPEYREKVMKEWMEALANNETVKEFKVNCKNGELKEIEMRSSFLQDGRIIVIGADVTERKLAEQELIDAKNRAEESDILKSAFLANMSHEIRTPMNAILGFAQLLESSDLEDEEKSEYVHFINKRGRDLLNIINDILDISKIEANQLPLHYTEGDINKLLFEVQAINTPKEKYGETVKAELRIGKTLKIHSSVMADFSRLQQILNNLIVNAKKFTESGYIEFGCSVEQKTLLFYVKDTGAGIPENKQNVIFERFRQAEESLNTRKFGGAGLGLSICKGLVELMQGKIWVESEVGVGSTFYFALPYIPISFASDEEKTSEINFDWSDKNILIVEDDDYNSKLISVFLSFTNARFTIVKNGADAINEVLNKSNFDLILMDIQLPDISGYDVSEKILEIKPDLKIIAQTAYAFEEDRLRSQKAGCCDFIAKPLEKDKFLKMLGKYLN